MGGEGSAIRWFKAGLMLEDLFHPRAKGSDLMGHLIDLALERARRSVLPDGGAGQAPPGLVDGESAMKGTFRRLAELDQGRGQRVAVAQLGAPHASAQAFMATVRTKLTDRFGVR